MATRLWTLVRSVYKNRYNRYTLNANWNRTYYRNSSLIWYLFQLKLLYMLSVDFISISIRKKYIHFKVFYSSCTQHNHLSIISCSAISRVRCFYCFIDNLQTKTATNICAQTTWLKNHKKRSVYTRTTPSSHTTTRPNHLPNSWLTEYCRPFRKGPQCVFDCGANCVGYKMFQYGAPPCCDKEVSRRVI